MAVYEIQVPDGSVFEIEAPDSMSEEEVLNYAKGEINKGVEARADEKLKADREMVGEGMKFRPFGADLDKGISQVPGLGRLKGSIFDFPLKYTSPLTAMYDDEMPQELSEFLAGSGRRLTQIRSAGTDGYEQSSDRLLNDSGYATAGGAATDMAVLAAGGMGLASAKAAAGSKAALGNAQKAVNMMFNPKNIAEAAGTGAAYGAATNRHRTMGATLGALGGGLGHGLPAVAGAAFKPTIQKGAKQLLDQGVELTPGQISGGWVKALEDMSTSIPIAGNQVAKAQAKGLEGWNKTVVNDALKHIGKKLDDSVPAGYAATKQADDLIGNAYDDALSQMTVKKDQIFTDEIQNLMKLAKDLPEHGDKLQKIINTKILEQFNNPNNLLLGETFKKTSSSLRNQASKLAKDPDAFKQDLGAGVREANRILTDAAKRQNPAKGEALNQADKAYSSFMNLQKALNRAGTDEGIVTPAQLLSQIRMKTPNSKYATGQGFDQTKTQVAKEIFSQKVPDSGTAGRFMTGLPIATGAIFDPKVMLGPMGLLGMYSPFMQGLFRSHAQNPVSGLIGGGLRGLVPFSEKFGRGYALNAPVVGK